MNIPKQIFLRPAVLVGFLILLSTSLSVPPVYAATINFTGTIGAIELDNGSSAYSGLTVGDTITGRITYGNSAAETTEIDIDPPFVYYAFEGTPYGGYITGGSIVSALESSEVAIGDNNDMEDNAILLNNLFGAGSTTTNTTADIWQSFSTNDSDVSNVPFFGVSLFSLDTSLYSGTDFQALPPALGDTDFSIFLIGEDDGEDDIYLATGILTSITVVPDPPIGCGALLTTNTISVQIWCVLAQHCF